MRTLRPDKLKIAHAEDEVVALVRDYIGDWMPDELAHIPENCRPAKIRDAEDINELAFAMACARIASESDPFLDEMESFFAQACKRIAQIQTSVHAPV
jgi:hypothetical protein